MTKKTSDFKKLCRLAGQSVCDYSMIRQGDRILIGLSGGRDSMVLLHVMKHLKDCAPVDFELTAATFDPGFTGFGAEEIAEHCKSIGIGHHIIKMNVAEVLERKTEDRRPCVICSRLRRGHLYSLAEKLSCGKLALGHHLDDIAVSFFISLCRGGGLTTMGPNVPSDNNKLRVIRPFAYATEKLVKSAAGELDMPEKGICIYREELEAEGDRAYFGRLLDDIEKKIPDLKSNLLKSLSDVRPKYLLDRKFLDIDA